jgi:carboxylesterase
MPNASVTHLSKRSSMDNRAALPTLVMIHDLLGSPREFELTTQILSARDVGFHFLEIPGYSHGNEQPLIDWRAWVASAGALVDRHYGPDAELVFGGIGTGAALAAALALQPRPQRVRGVAMLSPTFAVEGPSVSPMHRVAFALKLDRWMSVTRRDPFGVKNPKTRKWIAREFEDHGASSIGGPRFPLRAMRESARLHAHIRPSLKSLPAPLLVLHATADNVSSVGSVSRLVEELGATARLVTLDHSYRMITMDNDRQRVAHELADFIGAPKRRSEPPREDARRQRTSVAAN